MTTKKIPTLACQKVCYTEVKYHDLDDFIQEVYGHEFSCVADQEWNNDTKKTVWAEKENLALYDQVKLDEFVKEGKYNFSLHVILSDLCNRGLMEPGKYLVSISW